MKDRVAIDDYSALAIVGGDGTIHEAINGMMYREDKKRLPLVLLPNGSGNDFASCFLLNSITKGLGYLDKGQTMKADVVKILLDFESEEELMEEARRNPNLVIHDHLRYCNINSSLICSAKCAKNAAPMKPYIGKNAYTISTLKEIIKGTREKYDIEFDGQ